jgi:arylsulfatase A-like enzyme
VSWGGLLLVLALGCGKSGPDRPNLILILADDMGYGDAGWTGAGSSATPVLDQLAAEGLRFDALYVSAPICLASRLGLMTGRYQQRIARVWESREWIPETDVEAVGDAMAASLGTELSRAGYATGVFGKWGLGTRESLLPGAHGFDRFSGFLTGAIDHVSHVNPRGLKDWWSDTELVTRNGYATHIITEDAVAFIRQHQHEPFFVFLSHALPHRPYQAPGDPPLWVWKQGGSFLNRRVDVVAPTYRRMLEEIDKSTGELIDTLKDLDLADDTVIVFLSDNGATRYGSNAPLRGGKDDLWEGGIRVPGFAWGPGRIAPGVSDELVSSLDVMPTLLDLAGVPTGPLDLDGISLKSRLLDGKALPDRALYWEHVPKQAEAQISVRRGDWKLVVTGEQPSLYDLSSDPGEQHDLAADEATRLEELQADLEIWRTTFGDT